MNLKKLFKVIFVDFMTLFIGILNGFLLPKYINIDAYAYIKTFTLYMGYAGMFHFGFSDGMYILLGGKEITEIRKEKIKGYLIVLMKILICVLIGLLLINYFFIKESVFTYFIVYTIPFQIVLFSSLLYRATGEFNKYVIIRSIINIFSLLAIIITVFFSKSPDSYIEIQIIGYIILAMICARRILKTEKKAEKINKAEIKLLINTGFIIMIANTVNNLFFSLDRWIVKANFTNNDFAYYSFGVSMLSLFTALIGSITVVFYPYLSKNSDDEKIIGEIKKYIILICSFAPVGYYVLEEVIKYLLPQYTSSLDVLGILILSVPFMTVINVIYSNLYKAKNKGKEYLKVAIKILVVALILNVIVVYLNGNSTSIAFATLISLVIWYCYSAKDFNGLEIKLKEIIYLSIYVILYITLKENDINSILKAIIFFGVISGSISVLFRKEAIRIAGLAKNGIKR